MKGWDGSANMTLVKGRITSKTLVLFPNYLKKEDHSKRRTSYISNGPKFFFLLARGCGVGGDLVLKVEEE